MGYKIWLDAAKMKDRKRILGELKSAPGLTGELWSNYGSHEWHDFLEILNTDPESAVKGTEVQLSVLKPFVRFNDVMIRSPKFQKLVEAYTVDAGTGTHYYNQLFYNQDEARIEELENNLERYNEITNADIAKAIRSADLLEAARLRAMAEKKEEENEEWLNYALKDFDSSYKVDIIKSLITISVDHFLSIFYFSDLVRVMIELFGVDYKAKVMAG